MTRGKRGRPWPAGLPPWYATGFDPIDLDQTDLFCPTSSFWSDSTRFDSTRSIYFDPTRSIWFDLINYSV